MDAAAAEQAVTPRYPFRGILLFKDSDARWLSSVSDSNQDVARIDANVLLSRRDREFYGDNVQPGLVVILSRPDDSDERESLYLHLELSLSSSDYLAFVFAINEADAADQANVNPEALVLESVSKLSTADQQGLIAILSQSGANSLTTRISNLYNASEQQLNTPCATPVLQAGIVFVVADDDKMVRMMSKQQLKSANCHPDSLILGVTLAEAKTVPAKLMQLATKHGHRRVIALFDQNLDSYAEGSVFGSEMCQQLREQGFQGIICIRTSNNPDQTEALCEMGADLVVSKSSTDWPWCRVSEAIARLL